MIWPPVKAWTSKQIIDGYVHFVAINYGGKLQNRWVILMSVLDSRVVVKADWSQLLDSSKWKSGWDENNTTNYSRLTTNQAIKRINSFQYPSIDSGLTIPITKKNIRPWFEDV